MHHRDNEDHSEAMQDDLVHMSVPDAFFADRFRFSKATIASFPSAWMSDHGISQLHTLAEQPGDSRYARVLCNDYYGISTHDTGRETSRTIFSAEINCCGI
jgi:hypothetical protein